MDPERDAVQRGVLRVALDRTVPDIDGNLFLILDHHTAYTPQTPVRIRERYSDRRIVDGDEYDSKSGQFSDLLQTHDNAVFATHKFVEDGVINRIRCLRPKIHRITEMIILRSGNQAWPPVVGIRLAILPDLATVSGGWHPPSHSSRLDDKRFSSVKIKLSGLFSDRGLSSLTNDLTVATLLPKGIHCKDLTDGTAPAEWCHSLYKMYESREPEASRCPMTG